MTATSAPCDWPIEECGCVLPGLGEDVTADFARSVASELMWALSGRQFGCCEVARRPCREDCFREVWSIGPRWTPALIDGRWTNLVCGGCGPGRCSCTTVHEVYLPGPICDIVEVKVDGDAVPTGSYRVDDGAFLVRTDGGSWPLCNEASLSDTDPGTWSVRYTVGVPVPDGGARAGGIMACEIWKACTGDQSCCLPRRIQTLAKTGVAVLDPMEFLDKGRTGVPEVDLWLRAVNPYARQSAARIVSPDWDPGRVQTWP